MKRDVLIGIDAGTSVIKSIAFDRDGTQIGSFARPNLYGAVDGVGAEQDMGQAWNDTAATLRGLASVVPDLAERCIAVAVTGQGDGTWLIDDDGRPVGAALLWLDARSAAIAEAIRSTPRGRIIFESTGTGLNACQQSVQLLWLKQHRPDMLARASTVFHCKDWLYFNLTGTRAADPSESVLTFGDFRTRHYAPAVIEALGLGAEAQLLPPIVDGLDTQGRLSAAAALETGLPAGLPVVLGYIDIVASALGAGLFDENETTGCTIIGSTGMHMRLARSVADVSLNTAGTGYTIAFPVPGTFAQLQSNMASTLNIDWLLDLARGILSGYGIAKSRGDLLADLDARVLAAAPGTLLFHPYISEAGERGPFVDSAARASFQGLSLRHDFNDLTRGVYEGLAFAARDCYAAMGPIPPQIRVTGGAARSKALRTILASTLATDVRTSSREEAGAAGAAMMAAVATGLYPSMSACTERWVTPRLGASLHPDPALVARYDRLFPAYVAARQGSAPIWQALHEQRIFAFHG